MPPLATVGILSLGDMGLGIANLLIAHNFRAVTNATGRSPYTHARATSAGVALLASDAELVQQSDYVLSIVPPGDALSVASRVAAALGSAPPRPAPLYFLDLNATSPSTAQKMAASFSALPDVRVLDGGIIGGPPKLPEGAALSDAASWYRPSLVVSGPTPLAEAPVAGKALQHVLNVKHVHDTIGPATGLKMVFASLNKGFTALAIQAYGTAEALHVLPELRAHMAEYSPALAKRAETGMPGMCPKAYRWVAEMDEIADTMRLFGGFAGREADKPQGGDLFGSIGEIFRFVADDTPLGKERIGERKLGTTAEDVARVCAENLTPEKHV